MIPLFSAGKIALGSIRSAKLRSTLTVLGIVIGVAAVIANVSLGASFNQHFTNEVTNLGSNFIYIQGMQPKLFYDNEMKIVENTPGISGDFAFEGADCRSYVHVPDQEYYGKRGWRRLR